MKKNICVITISCSCITSGILACSEIATTRCTDPGFSTPNTYLSTLLSVKSYDQLSALTNTWEKSCGICGKNDPEAQELWYHPLGDKAHTHCLELVKYIEKSTIHGYSCEPGWEDYGTLHRAIILMVMKLCFPETIAEYIKRAGETEVTRFYNGARDFAFLHYLDTLSTIDELKKETKEELFNQIKNDKKLPWAFYLLGMSIFQKNNS